MWSLTFGLFALHFLRLHTIAHPFAYTLDCPHTHTRARTQTHTTNDTICFPKNAHFLDVGKYVVVFRIHPWSKCTQCDKTALDPTDRQIETQTWSCIRLKIVEISMSLSSIVVISTNTKCYPNWSYFLATTNCFHLGLFFSCCRCYTLRRLCLVSRQKFLLSHRDKCNCQCQFYLIRFGAVIWIK